MKTIFYVYFGFDEFKNCELSKNFKGDKRFFGKYKEDNFFFCLKEHFKDCIVPVYLGWSFSIFKFGDQLFHSGFLRQGVGSTKVFENANATELVIACAENKVFACNNRGRIFIYTTTDINPISFNLAGQKLDIHSLVTGDCQTVALMLDGSVQLLEKIEDCSFTLTTPLLCPKIIQVACGKAHSLLLSESGEVYCFGSGSHGQLGLGTVEDVKNPTLIEALAGIKIKSIACGGWHSTALSCVKDLYIWGWNDKGQLGFPCPKNSDNTVHSGEVETVCCLPKIVEFGREKQIEIVSCGTQHTAVLTEDSEVWTWGWNEYHQLGHEIKPICDKPVKVIFSQPSFLPQKVQCAFWSTLVSGIMRKESEPEKDTT